MFRAIRSSLTTSRTQQVAGSRAHILWTRQESTEARVPLLLFDIANKQTEFSFQRAQNQSSLSIQSSFSPNTIRSRLALHYKGLKYTQSWISYPDIERLWKELKILPNDNQGKGAPRCTLPVLLLRTDSFPQDSLERLDEANVSGVEKPVQTNYGVFTPVVSTLSIATVLDILFRKQDAFRPLFPTPQSFDQAQEVQSIITRLLPAMRILLIPSVPDILDARGREYFIRTRRQWFNVSSLDELRPKSEKEMDELWQEVEDVLGPVIRLLGQSKLQRSPPLNEPPSWDTDHGVCGSAMERRVATEGNTRPDRSNVTAYIRYLSGTSTPTYADFILMAFLAWIARVDMDMWARITQEIGSGVLKELWMGCLPYMKSHTYVRTLPWFR
ncbi:hypothetical protein H2200_003776 [Cladophialophora chaetospira]|uniref:Glutathione S-transferase UstS-like C-terminal domain-containing protein n=1 Tax=Cladophialophora chaetospira TaxID=386627 RepID=A0AA38XEX3_9EURO|nr:hypothetical protein H2200_003776 [Cladophialophora chaetospira]